MTDRKGTSHSVPWYWCGWSFMKHPKRDALFTHGFFVFRRQLFRAPWVYVGDVEADRGPCERLPSGRDPHQPMNPFVEAEQRPWWRFYKDEYYRLARERISSLKAMR